MELTKTRITFMAIVFAAGKFDTLHCVFFITLLQMFIIYKNVFFVPEVSLVHNISHWSVSQTVCIRGSTSLVRLEGSARTT